MVVILLVDAVEVDVDSVVLVDVIILVVAVDTVTHAYGVVAFAMKRGMILGNFGILVTSLREHDANPSSTHRFVAGSNTYPSGQLYFVAVKCCERSNSYQCAL